MIVPEIITNAARDLRKNMTKSEIELWSRIKNKNLGVKFMRQRPVYVYTENSGLDRFVIPDFYCAEKSLIIELDGGIHENIEVLDLDREKEKLLKNKGITIIRFRNEEIFENIGEVLDKIKYYI
ncbi:MAG: DUF559 domain-containing protein [Candidatus Gracilibacteria bacterium]|nr:DUF559 domain-containing protein [Candidatus Gracilibacteria bacterium]